MSHTTAHVGHLDRQPDAGPLRAVQCVQTGQTDHASASNMESKARKCIASKPDSTIRLYLFASLTSIALLGTRGADFTTASLHCNSTARNCASSSRRKRFFHSYNCHSRIPRSRQNTATLCPLATCSEATPRHFDHCSVRARFIPLHRASTTRCTRWGLHSAHFPPAKMGKVLREIILTAAKRLGKNVSLRLTVA